MLGYETRLLDADFFIVEFRVVDMGLSLSGPALIDVAEAPSEEGVRPAWLRDEAGHKPHKTKSSLKVHYPPNPKSYG